MSELPETMRAIAFDTPGDPDVMTATEIEVPEARPGEVLIKVSHAGVNRPDVVQRRGLYPPPPGASPILGLEVSGSVAALGEGVTRWLPGEKICALVPGGGYAEYVRVDARHCLAVPEGVAMDRAAAMPETMFTVWHNVFQRGMAREGETILVHGGTSGIGTTAIQLCKAFGMNVIVTCGSDAKCDAARDIGADHAINYKDADFVAAVKEITEEAGVELVLDMVAGDYVARNMKCLAADGRHVTIAIQGGAKAEVSMAALMMNRFTLTGSTLRPRSDDFKALLAQDIAENAWPLVAEGSFSPVMDETFALEEAPAAHARMEAGDHIGKIVLAVATD